MADSSRILAEPHPFPYFATVFSWIGVGDAEQREAFVAEIFRIAAKTPGFLGAERAREAEVAFGITIFYWSTREALEAWGAGVERHARDSFRDGDQSGIYENWILRVAEVQDALRMPAAGPA